MLVVGYLSLDTIVVGGAVHESVPGGAALYAALGAACAGADVALVAACGWDFPDGVLADLAGTGVDVRFVVRRDHPTRRARIIHGAAGARRSPHYDQPEWHGATRALAPPPPPATARPAVVVLTPMATAHLGEHLVWARAVGARVVMDTSELFAAREHERLLALLGEVDLFAPSREETRVLCPGLDDDAALAALARRCPRVVQKRGRDGLALVSRTHPEGLHVPAPPADVVDPTGAGDAAVGALGAGLARGLPDAALLALAVQVGARAVSAVGPAALGGPGIVTRAAGPAARDRQPG